MKNLKLTSTIILLFTVIYACKKEDTAIIPTPVVTVPITKTSDFTGCRIEKDDYGPDGYLIYTYSEDNYLKQIEYFSLRTGKSTVDEFLYANGLVTGIVENGTQTEAYSYQNGLLSNIKVLNVLDKDYRNYSIDIKMDEANRIIKMTDSKGFQSDLNRDEKGNLIGVLITRISDKKEFYRYVRSNFDGKKTIHELFKGWQFDMRNYYAEYMQTPNFIIGGSGNPLNVQIYKNEILTFDADYEYTYNSQGYWTSQTFTNKLGGNPVSTKTTYLCK